MYFIDSLVAVHKEVRFTMPGESFTESSNPPVPRTVPTLPSPHRARTRASRPARQPARFVEGLFKFIVLAGAVALGAIAVGAIVIPLDFHTKTRAVSMTFEQWFQTLPYPTFSLSPLQRSPPSSPPPCATVHDQLDQLDKLIVKKIRQVLGGSLMRRDFASKANGGLVLPTLTTQPTKSMEKKRAVNAVSEAQSNPDVVIEENPAISNCWAVNIPGQIGLWMPAVIHPTHVTIEHTPKEVSAAIGRAPRRLVLWGVIDGSPNKSKYASLSEEEKGAFDHSSPSITTGRVFVSLADFEYDIDADFHIQTFPVSQRIQELRMDFGLFVLEVLGSWGAEDVCMYRVRIHGELKVRAS